MAVLLELGNSFFESRSFRFQTYLNFFSTEGANMAVIYSCLKLVAVFYSIYRINRVISIKY